MAIEFVQHKKKRSKSSNLKLKTKQTQRKMSLRHKEKKKKKKQPRKKNKFERRLSLWLSERQSKCVHLGRRSSLHTPSIS